MNTAETSVSEIVESLPTVDELRERLARNIEERALLRKLLKVAEQRSQGSKTRGAKHA